MFSSLFSGECAASLHTLPHILSFFLRQLYKCNQEPTSMSQTLLGFQNTPGAITLAKSGPPVSPTIRIPQTPSSSGSWEPTPTTSSSWTLTPWTWKTTARTTLSKSTTPWWPLRAAWWRSEFVFWPACFPLSCVFTLNKTLFTLPTVLILFCLPQDVWLLFTQWTSDLHILRQCHAGDNGDQRQDGLPGFHGASLTNQARK